MNDASEKMLQDLGRLGRKAGKTAQDGGKDADNRSELVVPDEQDTYVTSGQGKNGCGSQDGYGTEETVFQAKVGHEAGRECQRVNRP